MRSVRADGVDPEYESVGREGDPAILPIVGFVPPIAGWPDWLHPGAEILVVPGMGHDLPEALARVYLNAIGGFAAKIETTEGAGAAAPAFAPRDGFA